VIELVFSDFVGVDWLFVDAVAVLLELEPNIETDLAELDVGLPVVAHWVILDFSVTYSLAFVSILAVGSPFIVRLKQIVHFLNHNFDHSWVEVATAMRHPVNVYAKCGTLLAFKWIIGSVHFVPPLSALFAALTNWHCGIAYIYRPFYTFSVKFTSRFFDQVLRMSGSAISIKCGVL